MYTGSRYGVRLAAVTDLDHRVGVPYASWAHNSHVLQYICRLYHGYSQLTRNQFLTTLLVRWWYHSGVVNLWGFQTTLRMVLQDSRSITRCSSIAAACHVSLGSRIAQVCPGALPNMIVTLTASHGWLIAKGKTDQARRILTKYYAGGDIDSPLVAFEMQQIENSVSYEQATASETSWLDLVRNKVNRKRTLIAVIVGFYGTWSGIAIVAYYLTFVLDTIGITDTSSQILINGLTQVFNLGVSLVNAALIDRMGRRPLWLWGIVGMLCSYIGWTILSSRFEATNDVAIGRSVLAFIFLYKLFYDGTYSPMLLAYPIEIFPYTLRGRGLSASIGTNQIALIIAHFVNPVLYWMEVLCCLLYHARRLSCIRLFFISRNEPSDT